MASENKSILRRWTDKLYGGLNMSWPVVIVYAIATAVVTAVFLIVPIFKNTSFYRMGETFEAWIFFAVIIMANCKKPLESALKTFVFFLISQPLIYLLQVPFSWQGWNLFAYYKYWFIWTLLCLPMAYVGWYIKKRSWLSLLILAPVLFALTSYSIGAFQHTFAHFPRLLITAVFCLAQVLLYLYVFTEKRVQKLLGFLLPLAAVLVILFTRPQVQLSCTNFLPDEPVLTEDAVIEMEESQHYRISVASTGEDSMIYLSADRYGTVPFTIRDGENEYRYTLEVYEDDDGHAQVRITPAE